MHPLQPCQAKRLAPSSLLESGIPLTFQSFLPRHATAEARPDGEGVLTAGHITTFFIGGAFELSVDSDKVLPPEDDPTVDGASNGSLYSRFAIGTTVSEVVEREQRTLQYGVNNLLTIKQWTPKLD